MWKIKYSERERDGPGDGIGRSVPVVDDSRGRRRHDGAERSDGGEGKSAGEEGVGEVALPQR